MSRSQVPVRKRHRIVMWSFRARPSFRMRARQLAGALCARGHAVMLRTGPGALALAGVRDAIVVLVKDQPWRMSALAARGNRLVLDAIDFDPDRQALGSVHAVICASDHVRARLARRCPSTPLAVVYHHADPRLSPHRAGWERLRLVYSGEKENSRFLSGEIPGLATVPFRSDDWTRRMTDYNAHFSARLAPSKSVVKLANAAALGAVYLAGAEPGCVELLGADYPFFLRDPTDLAAVRADVARLGEAVGTPALAQAVERIVALRPRLTLDATASAYERLFDELA